MVVIDLKEGWYKREWTYPYSVLCIMLNHKILLLG